MDNDYISVIFRLKPPKTYHQSIINTIVLILNNIRNMEKFQEWDDIDTLIFNDNIDRAINELESLRITKFKEE